MLNAEKIITDSLEVKHLKLLSLTEVARLLGIGKDNVYSMLRAGQLGFIEIGKRKKIPVLEIQNYIIRQTQYQIAPIKINGFEDAFIKKIIHTSKNKVTKSFDARQILEQIRRKK